MAIRHFPLLRIVEDVPGMRWSDQPATWSATAATAFKILGTVRIKAMRQVKEILDIHSPHMLNGRVKVKSKAISFKGSGDS
jgi:hypothetical protein